MLRRARWLAGAAALAGVLGSALAASGARTGSLPLGDGRVSSRPERGAVLACEARPRSETPAPPVPWIRGHRWFPDEKPIVAGAVAWPDARVTIEVVGDIRAIRTNGLPPHPSGAFPVPPDDPASRYAREAPAIRARDLRLVAPAVPTPAPRPSCVPIGLVGVAVDGVAFYRALDAAGRDAGAREVHDACGGTPDRAGRYHYRGAPTCLDDARSQPGRHGDLLGYALDGYGVFGMHGEGGRVLYDADLDACHGHTHAVVWDGERRVMYHYHLTREFPYTVGCFRGRVDPALLYGPGPRPPRASSRASEGFEIGPPADPDAVVRRAAEALRVPPGTLRRAIEPPPIDYSRAARDLGVTEPALRRALHDARGRR